jgi:hypothetical protein
LGVDCFARSKAPIKSGSIFNGLFLEAIKMFQRRHGAVLGAALVKSMNIAVRNFLRAAL